MAEITDLIERVEGLPGALHIAAHAHCGQRDKAGAPYLSHILRMVTMALNAEADNDLPIVVALHDVVEDSALSFDDLRMAGFSERVIDAVEALTRREGESYPDFIKRCCDGGDLARAAKQIDIEDNMRPERLSALGDATRLHLQAKYVAALHLLRAHKEQHDG